MNPMQIPGVSGWPGIVLTIFAMIVYGWYTNKSVKSKVEDAQKESEKKVEDIAKQANADAISAMQMHLNILRGRMEEAEKENVRLNQVVETVYSALESMGMEVTIRGKMVHIRDNKGGSTTIHISDIEKKEQQP